MPQEERHAATRTVAAMRKKDLRFFMSESVFVYLEWQIYEYWLIVWEGEGILENGNAAQPG